MSLQQLCDQAARLLQSGDIPEAERLFARVLEMAPDNFTACQALGNFDDAPLPHAIDQQVGLAIQDDRPADLVAPIIVMGQPPQAGGAPGGQPAQNGKPAMAGAH